MKSDIEIAQAANMIPIWEVAEQLNIPKDELEMYGKYNCLLYTSIGKNSASP